MIVLIILAVLFQICLATTDALFNKMIRNHVENWEDLGEFEWITLTLLVGCSFLPAGMLATISFKAVWLYGVIFCFVQWDMIFGKIVNNKWFGDTPMMKCGGKWLRISLRKVLIIRIAIGVALLCGGLIYFYG